MGFLALAAALLGLHVVGTAAPDPILPNPRLTPGAVATSDPAVFCHPGYSREHRHTSERVKARIYQEYGIVPGKHSYEIDDLIPISLGGANAAPNLWPQSYDTRPWNAEVKDRLEWRMLHLVCYSGLSLKAARKLTREAQRAFATNWIKAYQRWCGTAEDCPATRTFGSAQPTWMPSSWEGRRTGQG